MKKFLFLLAPIVFVLLAVPAGATTGNPHGNNGFVKISDEVLSDNVPQNHPHVGCNFKVEFYNYDRDNSQAKVKFELQAPTNKGQTLKVASGDLSPFIGEDVAGGGNDLDAVESYKLVFTGEAHEQQGYHVKLTVNAPGSQGADKKHKVFWVQPCAEETDDTDEPQIGGTHTNLPNVLPATGSNAAGVTLGLSFLTAATAYAVGYLRRKSAE